jgi:hypothetical protein
LHDDISSNVKAAAAYTVRQAIEDWLEDGLDSRSEATISKYRYVLRPVIEKIGRAVLRELTANDVRRALNNPGGRSAPQPEPAPAECSSKIRRHITRQNTEAALISS